MDTFLKVELEIVDCFRAKSFETKTDEVDSSGNPVFNVRYKDKNILRTSTGKELIEVSFSKAKSLVELKHDSKYTCNIHIRAYKDQKTNAPAFSIKILDAVPASTSSSNKAQEK